MCKLFCGVYMHSSIFIILILISIGVGLVNNKRIFNIFRKPIDRSERKYGNFPESLRLEMLSEAKKMFYFGYDNYMAYGFPLDELNPILCSGRGPDFANPSNLNINDILGEFCLTLVDSLDTLAVLGNVSEFQYAVSQVIENVNFDKDNVVQVFEVNIRVLGSLLSAHLLMMDPKQPFGELKPSWYQGELLQMAHDLASRLLPAFEASTTGIPYPRVNLRRGILPNQVSETCTAGAGSLVLEFGLLSRLLGDPVYEGYARRASKVLWNLRAKTTGLLGNMIDAQTGKWLGKLSGLGAGQDSFYEYLLKSYVMFGEHEDYYMFAEAYRDIKQHMRRGRPECNAGVGDHPIYINVDMTNGAIHTTWIDSLQAAFAGIQVLGGDIEEAICSHALYYAIWKRYGVLPERWNWQSSSPEIAFYPLRPELVESTYLLYQATKNPFYLHVGMDILESLNKFTKTECGYATVHSVLDKSLEDRMESFFLSETCKYLYLLFDTENYVNTHFTEFLFSTEGHLFPVDVKFRMGRPKDEEVRANTSVKHSCDAVNEERKYFLPLQSEYFTQIISRLGLKECDI